MKVFFQCLQIKKDLLSLRNKSVSVLMIINLLIIFLVFFMDLNSSISIPWIFDPTVNFSVLLAMMLAYLCIMSMQLLAMILHRIGTFMHIMSSTLLFPPTENEIPQTAEFDLETNGVAYADELQDPGNTLWSHSGEESLSSSNSVYYGRRQTAATNRRRMNTQRGGSIRYEDVFLERVRRMSQKNYRKSARVFKQDNRMSVKQETGDMIWRRASKKISM